MSENKEGKLSDELIKKIGYDIGTLQGKFNKLTKSVEQLVEVVEMHQKVIGKLLDKENKKK